MPNSAPTLADLATSLTVDENDVNAAAILIDGDVSFADAEDNLDGGTLTVSGLLAEDRVAVRSVGDAPGEIRVDGSDIRYGGTVIGSFTGGAGATLEVTFNSLATSAAVEALIENLTYANVSHAPTASRTLVINVSDAAGADLGGGQAIAVEVTAQNDPSSGADKTIATAEDIPYVFDEADFGFADLDNGFGGVVVTTLPSGTLYIDSDGAGIGSRGTAVTAGQFVSAADIAADRLVYVPAANQNGIPLTSFIFRVRDDDGGNAPTLNTITFNVSAVNDAPVPAIFPPTQEDGIDRQVNQVAGGNQNNVATAGLADGSYVAVWQSEGQDGDGGGIYARRYDASGAPISGETRVNVTTVNGQGEPSVVALADGGYVVTWTSGGQDGSGNGVFFQCFDADGIAQSIVDTQVNSYTTDNQGASAVAALADGGFVVAWESNGQDGSLRGIFAQRFDADGAALGDEIPVNSFTAGEQTRAAVAGLAGGGFVVTWESEGQDGNFAGVYAQRFDEDGVPQGGEVRVNTFTPGRQEAPVIAALTGGDYVIAWEHDSGTLSGEDIYAQRYNAFGDAVGGNTVVNSFLGTGFPQHRPSIAALSDGGYAVSWTGIQDNSGFSVHARRFDAAGGGEDEFRVNTLASQNQDNTAVAGLAGHAFVVAWVSRQQDGDIDGVFSKLLTTGLTATEQTALNLKGSVRVADVDAGTAILTATLSVGYGILDVTAGGSGATVVSGSGTGTVLISGTQTQLNALLRTNATSTITYTPNSDAPPPSTPLTISVSDGGSSGAGGALTGVASFAIAINPVDDGPPVLTDLAASAVFAENDVNAAPQPIDADVSLADPDVYLHGGSLTVAGLLAEDRVGVRDEGMDAGEIGVDGSDISYGGTVIGSFSGGVGNAFVVTFNNLATVEAVEALIENLTYANVSNVPTADRTLTLNVEDGAGGDLGDPLPSILVSVTAESDPPSGSDTTRTIDEDEIYTFAVADFGFSDAPEFDDFLAVLFATAPTGGTLWFDADGAGGGDPVALTYPATIQLLDIQFGRLSFVPAPNLAGESAASVGFQVMDEGTGDDTDPTPNFVTFDIDNVDNDSPSGADKAIDIDEDEVLFLTAADFGFSDPDPGAIFQGFRIVDAPDNGTFFFDNDGAGPQAPVAFGDGTAIGFQDGRVFFYVPDTNGNGPAFDSFTFNVQDEFGTEPANPNTFTIDVAAIDDAAVAENDAFAIDEATAIAGDLFADNGSGIDVDEEGDPFEVAAVLGLAGNVGTQVTLASGALLTVNADGTFDYDPNGAFDDLPSPGSGASNLSNTDSFSYTLTGGDTATVTITLTGLDSSGDVLLGTSGSDTLSSGIGDDSLDGDSGIDRMAGGAGDDTYHVDMTADRVMEGADGGYDTVIATASYRLDRHVEALTLAGSAAINATGNAIANMLTGNSAANRLNGLGGADTMAGGDGNDSYVVDHEDDVVDETGSSGNDTVLSAVSFALPENVEKLILTGNATIDGTGNAIANLLQGNAAANRLDGGEGADRMIGGAGDDTYVVDDAGDVVKETRAGDGTDTVESSVDYSLGRHVENLTLTGTDAIDGTGNAGANRIIGNAAANRLNGGGGDDAIHGGLGNDVLFGGAGADSFHFDTRLDAATNVDALLLFAPGVDRIVLDAPVFGAIAAGTLAAAAFVIGNTALDGDDRILYDAATGEILYDADGDGAVDAILFATVAPGTALAHSDFVVFM